MVSLESNIEYPHFSDYKKEVRKLLDTDRNALRELLKDDSAPREKIFTALQMLEPEKNTNPREYAMLHAIAMQHPDAKVRSVAEGMAKQRGLPISRTVDASNVLSVGTLPVITKELAENAMRNPEAMTALAKRYMDSEERVLIPMQNTIERSILPREGASRDELKQHWRNYATNQQHDIVAQSYGRATGQDAEEVKKETVRNIVDVMDRAGVTVETIVFNREEAEQKINAVQDAGEREKLRMVAKHLRDDKESFARLQSYNVLTHLADLDNPQYYNDYLATLTTDMSADERAKQQRKIIRKAIVAEQQQGKNGLTAYIVQTGNATRKSITALQRSTNASATPAEKAAVVAGAIAEAGVTSVQGAGAPGKRTETVRQAAARMSPGFQAVLRTAERVYPLENGRFAIKIPGSAYTVQLGLNKENRLVGYIQSTVNDRTFPFEDLTVGQMEVAMITAAIYDSGKEIFDVKENRQDTEILAKVYNIRPDEKLASAKELRLFEESLKSLSPFRQEIIALLKEYGVITQHGTTDESAATALNAQLAFLEATDGLQNTTMRDLRTIAKARQKLKAERKPVSVLTEGEATQVLNA